MGDEPLYLFDVLVHRFLDGSGGRVVQIPQRKPADVFGQADTQSIEYAESRNVGRHQGGIQQYQSADKSPKRYPSPTYHDGSVRSGGISSMRQQFFQNFINRPIGHEHTHRAASRQHACHDEQPFLLSRYLEQPGQTFFLFCLIHCILF